MEKVFNPGKFNKRIAFLKKTAGQDDYGEPIDTWVTFKNGWANKFDFIGTDFYVSQTDGAKIEVKFSCRYAPGITKDMRIQHGADIYEIVGAPADVGELKRELLCYCKAV